MADTPKTEPGRHREGRSERHARDVEVLANLLDDRFRIPGTNIRFGFDSLLGLIPAAGDWLTATASLYVVGRALALRAPASVVARMVGNIVLDLIVGAVPLLGDLFDVGFKANRRNVQLLDEHVLHPEDTRRASRLRVTVGLLLAGLVVVGVLGALAWLLARLFEAALG